MAEYRAYFVGADGRFVGFEPLTCSDDTEAIAKAGRFAVKHDVELWNRERLVRRLKVELRGKAISHGVKDGRMVPKK
jgi:hypothetical protein